MVPPCRNERGEEIDDESRREREQGKEECEDDVQVHDGFSRLVSNGLQTIARVTQKKSDTGQAVG